MVITAACFGAGAAVTAASMMFGHPLGKPSLAKETKVADDDDGNVVTLYLIRHGEAIHNIEERHARSVSRKVLTELGLNEGEETYEEIAKAARVNVLQSPRLHDAPLSDYGQLEAQGARERMKTAVAQRGLPMAEVVFVSPLQRALKTAAIIYEGHPDIRVVDELRERQTGLPCDERSSARMMRKRSTFQDMMWSFMDATRTTFSNDGHEGSDGEAIGAVEEFKVSSWRSISVQVEDNVAVRGRSRVALDNILQCGASVVGLVSHKGFLREFERGALGHPEATEFGNAEVRVYQLRKRPSGRYITRCLWRSPSTTMKTMASKLPSV
mmetsp:Transcript_8259/g.23667  ORF Transcript_8259/g.23667 Transcript_8259/m.23667 type:complete len:326 (-) Transcript_8259:106-1083(-)